MIDEISRAWQSEASNAMRVLSLGVNRCAGSPIEPDHAGVFETSLLAAMWPGLPQIGRLPSLDDSPAVDPGGDSRGAHRHQPGHPLWGIFGPDPRRYQPGDAQELLESVVSWLASAATGSLRPGSRNPASVHSDSHRGRK
jgi:creatinine amidohydrolase